MFIVNSSGLGSGTSICHYALLGFPWGNTRSSPPDWRFELFYWDYVIGMVHFSLFYLALTLEAFAKADVPSVRTLPRDLKSIGMDTFSIRGI